MWCSATAAAAKRHTPSRRWPPTCASTRSSTSPTGSWAPSYQKRSSPRRPRQLQKGQAMATQVPASTNEPPSHGLRRELRFWEAIAISIGIMAPTAAMALNGTAPAGLIGRAVPLAFIFATIGVLLVSYAFIRLSRYFSHAGSVYAFSGVTLGPRAGFFAGWALLGTYIAFVAASVAEVGLFGVAFFDSTGIWHDAEWLVIALVAGVGVAVFAYGDIRAVTRSLLG